MFDLLDTLAALQELGTMGKAAIRLRLTQSAISKRINTLEATIGCALTVREGRRVRLTAAGARLLDTARPFLAEVRGLGAVAAETEKTAHLVIGVSESLMASWGPPVLARLLETQPGLRLDIHGHRSLLAVEYVRTGEYNLALCALPPNLTELEATVIATEPMVIVPSKLRRFTPAPGETIPIITIESRSATWEGLSFRIDRLRALGRLRLEVVRRLESFTAVVQMARHGFGHGLVPLGVARAMGIPTARLLRLPSSELTRQIAVVGRQSTCARPTVRAFVDGMRESFRTAMGGGEGRGAQVPVKVQVQDRA